MLGLFNAIAARWGAWAAYRIVMGLVPLLALLLGLVAGGWGGWTLGRARLQTEQARQAEQAAEQAANALAAAQARGEALSQTLSEREDRIDQLTKEKRDAVTPVTTGRACLEPAALRVLDGAAGLQVARLPEAPGGLAATDAAIATDTDVARWALDAGARHEQCRDRLDALIAWHQGDEALNSHEPTP